MPNYAQLDEDNKVINVIVVSESDCIKNGNKDEATGIAFCKKLFGENTNWKDGSSALIDSVYDTVRKGFVREKPYPSWILDDNCDWQPPEGKERPENLHIWDEEIQEWI
jgi:hypothetical protein